MADPLNESSVEQKTRLEIEKLEHEVAKLTVETRALKRPWWQTPGYVLSMLPTVIAISTLFLAWNTGLLDDRAVNLDTKRAILEAQLGNYQVRKERITGENRFLQVENKRLEDERSVAALQVAKLATRTQDLETKAADLTIQVRQREEAVRLATNAARAAQRAALLVPYEQFLASLRQRQESNNKWGRERSGTTTEGILLVERMRADRAIMTASVEELAALAKAPTTTEDLKISILQLLATATGDDRWFQELIASSRLVARQHSSEPYFFTAIEALTDQAFVQQNAAFGWPKPWRLGVIRFALDEIASSQASIPFRQSMLELVAGINSFHGPLLLQREDPALCLRVVNAAIDSALDYDPDEPDLRMAAMRVFSHYAPPAYLVFASEIFTEEPGIKEAYIFQSVEITLRGLVGSRTERLKIPFPVTRERQGWTEWRDANRALVALWTGDIADRGSDTAFLRRAIEEAATE